MNEDTSETKRLDVSITTYSDGIINLVLDDGDEREKLQISQTEMRWLKETFGFEIEIPEPSKPVKFD